MLHILDTGNVHFISVRLHALRPHITQTLRSVEILSIAWSYHLQPLYFVESMSPLLQMPNLENVRIQLLDRHYHFHDQHLITLATAWPRLVNLALQFSVLPGDPVPRFSSLDHFNRLCASLRKLVLPVLALDSIDEA